MEIRDNQFKIIVKPNSSKNEISGYDKYKEAYRVNIKAKPNGNKANIEVIKFFSKLFKRKVRILLGLKIQIIPAPNMTVVKPRLCSLNEDQPLIIHERGSTTVASSNEIPSGILMMHPCRTAFFGINKN